MPVPEVSGGPRQASHSPIHPHVDLAVLNLDSDSFAGIDSNLRGGVDRYVIFDLSGTEFGSLRSIGNASTILREHNVVPSGTD
jgi:hypothetical protein